MGMIYRHISPTGKSYIGMTKHTWEIRATNNPISAYDGCSNFISAIKKYGWDNFIHEILEDNIPDDKLTERESYWIKYYDSVENGYNLFPHAIANNYKVYDYEKIISKDDLFELYINQGMTLREVGQHVGVDFSVINTLLKYYDIPPHKKGHLGVAARKKYEEMRNNPKNIGICIICNKEFIKGKKDSKLCSNDCRYKYQSQSTKGKIINKKHDRKEIIERNEKITKDYINGMKPNDICEKYNISKGTLWNALKDKNIPRIRDGKTLNAINEYNPNNIQHGTIEIYRKQDGKFLHSLISKNINAYIKDLCRGKNHNNKIKNYPIEQLYLVVKG